MRLKPYFSKLITVTLVALVALCGHVTAAQDKVVTLTDSAPVILNLAPNSNVTLTATTPAKTSDLYWLFEVHSQEMVLGLGKDSRKNDSAGDKGGFTEDTHHGFIVFASDLPRINGTITENATVTLCNPHKANVTALILVRVFTTGSPIPGICNQANVTDPQRNRPNLNLVWDENMVRLNFSLSGMPGTPDFGCNSSESGMNNVQYFVYHRYLISRNFDETYFMTEIAETMLLENDIVTNGKLVDQGFIQQPHLSFKSNIFFNKYAGIPSIYAVIVKHANNESSVYVSTATYACNLDIKKANTCFVTAYPLTKIVCAILIFTGFFLAFWGHRFFLASQFVFSLMGGYTVAYLLTMAYMDVSFGVRILLTFIMGSAGEVTFIYLKADRQIKCCIFFFNSRMWLVLNMGVLRNPNLSSRGSYYGCWIPVHLHRLLLPLYQHLGFH